MASPNFIPRFLLPRGPLLIRTPPIPRATSPSTILPLPLTIRHASSKASPPRKPLAEQLRNEARVIPQPDKYRPPSHGRRTPRSETLQKSYGAPPSAEDRERMRTKKYPNMMAPQGTFMHWFLNNRAIHLWITSGILISLAVAAWYMDLMHKTVYAELFPTKKEFFRAPLDSSKRFIEVYKMHVEQQTQVVHEIRMKKQEDTEKRKLYRLQRIQEAEERGEEYVEDPRYYVGEDGVRRRRVKRWFGIWE
ncbi:hypothetical protein K491DRAFT_605987 [Lophiostoma macrostomum CBS 122681]|uniref:Uncharacterized protein n=1 Tax=Lophiostoma macrostomum CBS 122681 TaxID=1314788 RepID=A0A6A6SW39_9PLEO|nr:hypothetical protein K491DRAFT_605987 [Lophiostoma macrostomum CBS 122681]